MNHYPRHVGDYIRDTVGLSMVEDGAYNRLLDQYYAREFALPTDSSIYRIARATTKAERAAVDSVLRQFFVKGPDGYRQKRADIELAAQHERSESARESAKRRWSERNANASAKAMRTHSEGSKDSMLASSQKPQARSQVQNLEVPTEPLSGCPPDADSLELEKSKINGADRGVLTRRLRADAVAVLEFLNAKAHRNYESVPANVDPIVSRFKEGFTATQCRQVVAKKAREWGHDEKMETYLRPKTLFSKTNFANYAGELVDIPEGDDAA